MKRGRRRRGTSQLKGWVRQWAGNVDRALSPPIPLRRIVVPAASTSPAKLWRPSPPLLTPALPPARPMPCRIRAIFSVRRWAVVSNPSVLGARGRQQRPELETRVAHVSSGVGRRACVRCAGGTWCWVTCFSFCYRMRGGFKCPIFSSPVPSTPPAASLFLTAVVDARAVPFCFFSHPSLCPLHVPCTIESRSGGSSPS